MYDADKSANILKLVSLSLINNAGYIDDKSGNPMLYKGIGCGVYCIYFKCKRNHI